jgi:hypothetical protein
MPTVPHTGVAFLAYGRHPLHQSTLAMTRNMGTTDRNIRMVTAGMAIVLAVLTSGAVQAILLVVAGILVVTSVMRTCPVYSILGTSTTDVPRKAA